MRAWRALMVPVLAGCIRSDPEVIACRKGDDSLCWPYLCVDDENGGCTTDCVLDEDCAEGYACPEDSCVEACDPDDCPDNLGCDEYDNVCETECITDSNCRPGYTCCMFGDEGCEQGACY